jgi:hypothetical protein
MAVDPHLEMHMGAMRAAGGTDLADAPPALTGAPRAMPGANADMWA